MPPVSTYRVAQLSEGLGALRDLDSVFGSSSSVIPNKEWCSAIENDIKKIPAFTEFFQVSVPTTQVMLPTHKSSRFSKWLSANR